MKNVNRVSEKKQKLIDEVVNKPYEIGEEISVPSSIFSSLYKGKDKNENAVITNVHKSGRRLTIKQGDGTINNRVHVISFDDVKSRDTINVGEDPFTKSHSNLRFIAYDLNSILFTLNVFGERNTEKYEMSGVTVKECNWNPYIYLSDGTKQYYQRDFVWSLEEKQLLIDSIYNDIDLGKVVIRTRGWNELERMAENGETDLAFRDIVDGKQRLHAIAEFIKGNFTDSHGNYFADLSFKAQHRLTSNQLLSYSEMPEESDDKDVIEQFLKVNFAGVQQSKEHIEFVSKLYEQI